MNLFFRDPQTVLRMHEGPLGQYIDSYASAILAKTTPPEGKPGRYRADDELLAFLKTL
jgi:hypothetical protein